MITKLPASITTIEEAKKFLTELYKNGESYHPEDNAKDCLENITDQEGDQLNRLMNEIYGLPGNENYQSMAFDPCGFILDFQHEHKRFMWKDKSGGGRKANDITYTGLKDIDDEENWDGISLAEWVRECEEGDEWENASDKYICTTS